MPCCRAVPGTVRSRQPWPKSVFGYCWQLFSTWLSGTRDERGEDIAHRPVWHGRVHSTCLIWSVNRGCGPGVQVITSHT